MLDGEVNLVESHMSSETRRLAEELAMAMYANEPCRICRRLIEVSDLHDLVFAGYSRDGLARAAHGVCWDSFVELLQTLPAGRLYELTQGKESDGKRTDGDGGGQ